MSLLLTRRSYSRVIKIKNPIHKVKLIGRKPYIRVFGGIKPISWVDYIENKSGLYFRRISMIMALLGRCFICGFIIISKDFQAFIYILQYLIIIALWFYTMHPIIRYLFHGDIYLSPDNTLQPSKPNK